MANQRHKDKEAGQVTSWLYIWDKKKLRDMAKENGLTMSDFIKKILDNFGDELIYFIQVCPKEMIDKLQNPLSLKQKIKEVS